MKRSSCGQSRREVVQNGLSRAVGPCNSAGEGKSAASKSAGDAAAEDKTHEMKGNGRDDRSTKMMICRAKARLLEGGREERKWEEEEQQGPGARGDFFCPSRIFLPALSAGGQRLAGRRGSEARALGALRWGVAGRWSGRVAALEAYISSVFPPETLSPASACIRASR